MSVVKFYVLVLVIACVSCDMLVPINKVEQNLSTKYQQEFVVTKDSFHFVNVYKWEGHNAFEAHLREIPQIKIEGYYPEDANFEEENFFVGDNFVERYYEFLANKKFAKLIQASYKGKFLVKTELYSSSCNHIRKGMITLEETLECDSNKYLAAYINFIDTLNENNKEAILNPIVEMANFFDQFEKSSYSIGVFFWDPKEVKRYTLDSTKIAYLQQNSHSVEVLERYGISDFDIKNNAIKQFIGFRKKAISPSITVDTLYSLIQKYKEASNNYSTLD